jgi:hypothetical protein
VVFRSVSCKNPFRFRYRSLPFFEDNTSALAFATANISEPLPAHYCRPLEHIDLLALKPSQRPGSMDLFEHFSERNTETPSTMVVSGSIQSAASLVRGRIRWFNAWQRGPPREGVEGPVISGGGRGIEAGSASPLGEIITQGAAR